MSLLRRVIVLAVAAVVQLAMQGVLPADAYAGGSGLVQA